MNITENELYTLENFRIEGKMLRKCLTDLGRSEEEFFDEIIEKYSILKDKGFDIDNKTGKIMVLIEKED